MYTVSKGPSKIVAKTRRGVSQNFDRLENRFDNRKQNKLLGDETSTNNTVPKPVFQGIVKRTPQSNNGNNQTEDVISPQHEELIKYVRDSWAAVCHQYHRCYVNKDSTNNNPVPVQSIVYYNDGERSPLLHDFKPFDLEQWWGKRMFNSIIKSQSG